MAWTTPSTFVTGQLVGATDLNTNIRDNTNYLMSGRPVSSLKYNVSTALTTTSTSFVDADLSNLLLTAVLSATRCLIVANLFNLIANNAINNYAAVDIMVNGSTRLGHATYGLGLSPQNSNNPVTIMGVATGLTPGTNTFKLQYKCGVAAASATIGMTINPTSAGLVTMAVWEY